MVSHALYGGRRQCSGFEYAATGFATRRLVDVGGWRRHLNCTGEIRPGQVTVILEAGAGDFYVEWQHANDRRRELLPADAQRMRTWALAQLGHVAAGVNPFDVEELALLRRERLKTEHPLGDLPLVVLTLGIPEETGPNAGSLEEDHRRDH